ncbi:MAG: acetylxylan esterase [Bryobacteraceae bacterium]|nr:acetylxylan esterase [Bryobacteraceae bacterium]
MQRRAFLPLLAAASAADSAEVRYRSYSAVFPGFLSSLAEKCYRLRSAKIAALNNDAAIRERQRYIRETLWRMIGGRPADSPLNARVTASFERSGYRVENVIYESRPGLHIPANLYIPTTHRPPFPGILFQMGHSLNGKAYPSYQRCCQALARLGYLVLAFDPMGQGERAYYPARDSNQTRLSSSDDEHTLPGRQLLLAGTTSTQIQLWDAVRSLDYLASHPQVDSTRLGSTGQSGGGTLTMLLAAVDDRLSAAVVCCGNTENIACAGFVPPGSTDDAEQNLIDGGPLTIDRWDLLYPFAPKPLLCLASARDFFGTYSPNYLASGREEFARLAGVYRTLKQENRVAWDEIALPHALSLAFRLRIYQWFGQWLKPASQLFQAEPPTEPEPDQRLLASPTGNVVRDFKGKTPLALAREAAVGTEAPVTTGELKRLLRLDEPPSNPMFSIISTVPGQGGIQIDAAEVQSVAGVWLPAWLFSSGSADNARPALVIVEPGGRASRWQEDALYQALAAKGYFVCAADVRGIGDLRPQVSPGAPGYASSHSSEENYAWASLVLGKPLIGQRTTDLLTLLAAVKRHPRARGRRIVLAASGSLTAPALMAAALSTDADAVYLHRGLVSYRTVLDKEEYTHTLANFIPGILNRFDLPAIAKFAAPRKIVLSSPVDASGGPATPVTASSNVEWRRNAGWDASSFDAL